MQDSACLATAKAQPSRMWANWSLSSLYLVAATIFYCAPPSALEAHAQNVANFPERDVRVRAGQKSRVHFFHGANKSCVQERGFTVSITKEPTKGQILLEKEPFVVDENWLSSIIRTDYERAKEIYDNCKGNTFLKIQIFYVSRLSQGETDYVEFERLSADSTRIARFRVRLLPR